MGTYIIAIIIFVVLILLWFGVLAPGEEMPSEIADIMPSQNKEAAPAPAPVPVLKTYTKSGCEGAGSVFSECPNGINSGTIKYGRWNNSICPHSTVNQNTAAKFKEYPLSSGIKDVPDAINTYVNDDPYSGTFKHYEVSYVC
jgi:hypothetical protein